MKNTERLGVDMGVAFSSEAKVLSSKKQASPDRTADLLRRGSAAHGSGWRGALARFAQSTGRYFYEIAKPVLRPLAFRLRTFLTATLRQEIQQGQLAVIRKLDEQALKQHNHVEKVLALHLQPLSQELASLKASIGRVSHETGAAVVCDAGKVQIRTGGSARAKDVLSAVAGLAAADEITVVVDFDALSAQERQAWRDALAHAGLEPRPGEAASDTGRHTVLFARPGSPRAGGSA